MAKRMGRPAAKRETQAADDTPRMGRPRSGRKVPVQAMFEEDEVSKLKTLADRNEVTLSVLIRKLTLAGLERQGKRG